MSFLRLRTTIQEQLHIEEALFRVDRTRNWFIYNDKHAPATIVMGISGKPERLLHQDAVKRWVKPYPREIMAWSRDFFSPFFARICCDDLVGNDEGLNALDDYVINDRKFGGNAQSLAKGRWLHHTSFLWDFDPRNMEYLTNPARQPAYRLQRDHTEFLVPLKDVLKTENASRDQFESELRAELAHNFTLEDVDVEEIEPLLEQEHRKSTRFLELYASSVSRIHPDLHRSLQERGAADVMVTMKASASIARENRGPEVASQSRGDRITDLVNRLESHSRETQAPVDRVLARESATSTPRYSAATSFWISNQVFIESASLDLILELLTLPEVAQVRGEQVLPLPSPVSETSFVNSSDSSSSGGNWNSTHNSSSFDIDAAPAPEWGVQRVQASSVWSTGNTGSGVVVASIDTGVMFTHEALKANFRKTYGWFDPEKKATEPYDSHGHGTHTMGTIAGSKGVGVAPGATWISCKGCRTDGCPESDLLACAQFLTCPTDTQGRNKDCSQAPHVVSNSWGGGQGDAFYQDAVDAWIDAGIIPIFANGNKGPGCGTVSSPGDYANVIAVGATDSSDQLASFSSKGPAVKGNLLKPDVSAPGVRVRSAYNTGNSNYTLMSGTSMATPHVSGVVALLLSAQPSLKFDDVKRLLTTSTNTNLKPVDAKTCGNDTSSGAFPNNNYGFGLQHRHKEMFGRSPREKEESGWDGVVLRRHTFYDFKVHVFGETSTLERDRIAVTGHASSKSSAGPLHGQLPAGPPSGE
ncbi:hypothetical protein BBJ28_00003997 [Nothophytophthora sp. Chile5]|nr:hypothetical protein BBJ28_00003997 [Nothophytophthora sp. Chile5]